MQLKHLNNYGIVVLLVVPTAYLFTGWLYGYTPDALTKTTVILSIWLIANVGYFVITKGDMRLW
jgi:hypothetical protein